MPRTKSGNPKSQTPKSSPESSSAVSSNSPATIASGNGPVTASFKKAPRGAEASTSSVKKSQNGHGQVGEDQIRERAYQLFLERGGKDGQAEDDWYRAESELRRRNVK